MAHTENGNSIGFATWPAILILGSGSLFAQNLNENCTVSVLNRTVQVSEDGGWSMPNVPSFLGDVRARVACIEDGVTRSGQTDFFRITQDGVTDAGPFVFARQEPIPSEIEIEPAGDITLNGAGEVTTLSVIARFPDDSTQLLTPGTGLNFMSSNSDIATVTADGLVTAVSSGIALITARRDGVTGIKQITVITSGDSDGDGLPDDYERANGLDPNDPIDAMEDQDLDGLSAAEEFLEGTDPNNSDTDGDTIEDGEEVFAGEDTWITNPLLPDTDGDGVRDALEITTGSDPTDPTDLNLEDALDRLEIRPDTFTITYNSIIGEGSRQVAVIGTLDDGFEIDLTARGTNYDSSDFTICNFGLDPGRIFGSNEGTCVITATNSTFAATANVTVETFGPIALSALALPGFAYNVDVVGGLAYVAAGDAGLQVVDVSDRSNPLIIGAADTAGSARDVRVVSNVAYVADGAAGLQIIDVSDAAAPTLLGAVNLPGTAEDVFIGGNRAYVALDTRGIAIIDVSNPDEPLFLGSIGTPGLAKGVAVSGDGSLALVADSIGGLQVVDVGDPMNPQIVGTAITGDAWDVEVEGDYAFVADAQTSLNVVDISDPTVPVVTAATPAVNGGLLLDVALSNRFSLGADFFFVNGVPIVDISDPDAPIPSAILDFSAFGDDNGWGIAADGNYVYLTTGNTRRLLIGQYLDIRDEAGIPPDVSLISPPVGATLIEGERVPVRADAEDDVGVAETEFFVDGQSIGRDTSPPYEVTATIPLGVSSVAVSATARDIAGNAASTPPRTLDVVPDPLTTAIGLVTDTDGTAVSGATVTVLGLEGTTQSDGSFSIPGISTIDGALQARAEITINDVDLSGRSLTVLPVRGGDTNLGTFEVTDFNAGYALRFDGNDVVVWGASTPLFQNTMEAWVRPMTPNRSVIFAQFGGPTEFCTIGAGFTGFNTRMSYDLNPSGCGNAGLISFDQDFTDQWVHIAGTFDGTTQRFYVNGVLAGERSNVTFRTSNWLAAGAFLLVGGYQFYFTGELDELRIWNVARTEAEIAQWMDRRLTGNEPGLTGYWTLDAGSGQIVPDSSPTGLNGFLGTNGGVEPSDPQWVESTAPIRN